MFTYQQTRQQGDQIRRVKGASRQIRHVQPSNGSLKARQGDGRGPTRALVLPHVLRALSVYRVRAAGCLAAPAPVNCRTFASLAAFIAFSMRVRLFQGPAQKL